MIFRRILALSLLALSTVAAVPPAAAQGSQNPNVIFTPAPSLTASGQTSTAVSLANGTQLRAYSLCTITIGGTFSAATFGMVGSADQNGTTYVPILIWPIAAPSSSAVTQTATAAGGAYQGSCGTLTHLKFVTSSTFTGTNITFLVTACPNCQVVNLGTAYHPGSVAITGGTIDGTAIGGTTPAPVRATTVHTTAGGISIDVTDGGGNGFGSDGGDTLTVYSSGANIALLRNEYYGLSSSVPICWGSGVVRITGCDGKASMSRDPSGEGVDIGQSSTVGDISGTIQAGVTTTDPGCTTTQNIGKQWFNITTTTTVYKLCMNLAGTPTWVTK